MLNIKLMKKEINTQYLWCKIYQARQQQRINERSVNSLIKGFKMKYSDIKKIRSFCDELLSTPDYREVLSKWGDADFEVDGVRFIREEAIDSIQCDDLNSDKYILGCFNGWFISNVLDIDSDVIEAMQQAEAYEAIGKLIISMGKLEELQQEYCKADGYGHHFNHYDGNEEYVDAGGVSYYVFDNH